MLSRAPALMPSSRTCACAALGSSNSAATNSSCSSRSAGMMSLQHAIGFVCFGNEHVERRNFRVPFDERWHRPESIQRRGVQGPHFVAYRRAVRVDANLPPADGVSAVAGEVNLLHDALRNAVEKSKRVEPM